jgi:hypothetical protein
MLRHRSDCPSAWRKRHRDLFQDKVILINMFKHIKRTNEIEFSPEQDGPGVELQQFNATSKTSGSVRQAVRVDLTASEHRMRQDFAQRGRDIARAAAQLQNATGRMKVTSNDVLDEPGSCTKPEPAILQRIQHVVRRHFHAVVTDRQRRRKADEPTDGRWSKTAGEATPLLINIRTGAL